MITKIAIIGNGGGGKSTLAKKMASSLNLPLTHVDSIQFLPGMNFRDSAETSEQLREIASKEKWIIDGFGSLEVMEERFQKADKIIFIDFPLWRHYWWCTKRQIKSVYKTREELPEGCFEGTLKQTLWLYKTLWRVHKTIRPQLVEIFSRKEIKDKVLVVNSLAQWQKVSI